MTSTARSIFAACGATLIAAILISASSLSTVEPVAADVLQATNDAQWRRGNIHTHSLWSDGDDYPEMIALWYADRGYDFLCYTDHNVLPTVDRWIDVEKSKGGRVAYDKLKAKFPMDWVDERTVENRLQVRLKKFPEVAERFSKPGEFLLIQGEEISDKFGGAPIHMNLTNAQELLPPMGGDSVYEAMQNNVNAVIAQRERTGKPILVHLNHPNFHYAITAEDLMRVRGENFFEVYNGHPTVYNSGDAQHASTERIWDIILANRITELDLPLMYGLATDDGHAYHKIPSRASEPGRGWVMVLARDLSPESLIESMESGRFYASSGVTLSKVSSSGDKLEVEVAAAEGDQYVIEFIGTRKGYDPSSKPVLDDKGKEIATTRVYSDDIGQVLKKVAGPKASYEFSGDELYVRARVTSSKLHPNPSEPGEYERAWVQPVYGPAGK